MKTLNRDIRFIFLAVLCGVASACSFNSGRRNDDFTVIMLPDTQNAIDFRRQTAEGFAIDSSDIFIEQMQYIAGRAVANGGDVAFVASVGDVWQHVNSQTDPEHVKRGITAIPNHDHPAVKRFIAADGTLNIEIPKAIEGYQIISEASIPFGVAPGNHDYDAWWALDATPPNSQIEGLDPSLEDAPIDVTLHVGGLSNFRSAFGSDTDFFHDRDWYLSGFEGGGSSAQIFSAGGYRFLHLAFEMHAGDDVVEWAKGVIDQHLGLPTIISTHDFLNPRAERLAASGMDLALVDPEGNNSAEKLWQDFISETDQIFMVLSGHRPGQAIRIDRNDQGHEVYQILADYQSRQQSALDTGEPPVKGPAAPFTGDGWLREMVFRLGGDDPIIDVRTYSSHFESYSSELDTYAEWYKDLEQPDMTDEEFLAAEEFTIELSDFHSRFGMPSDAHRHN
ncbi:MAG: hypothetical protein P8J68_02000 [Arenicellaceae bacterium]|nr:hypothetical protein [Arenicellaceae bacterium]